MRYTWWAVAVFSTVMFLAGAGNAQQIPAAVAALLGKSQAPGQPSSGPSSFAGLSIPPEFAQLAAMYGSNPSTAPSMDYSGFAMSPPGETSPSQAPGGSSDYADEESGSSSSFAFNPIPLAPYVEEYNLSLPSEFLLIEQAFRFVSPQANPVTEGFREAVEKTYGSFLSSGASLGINITITSIEPSIASPVEYANGTGPPTSAPAPGPAPALGRKLQQLTPPPMGGSPSQYVSSDMIVDTYAGPSSTFLEVTQPSQLLGYVAVGLLQYGYQVQIMALGYHVGPKVVPLVAELPLAPIYILETIIQVQFAQGFTAFTVEEENMILLAANSILGSQQSYEWNVLLETWVDPPTGNVRTILKTYVTENYTSIDQILAGSFGTLLQQKADQAGILGKLTIVDSQQVGTFRDEFLGHLQDLSAAPSPQSSAPGSQGTNSTGSSSSSGTGGSSLSGGAIAGIVVGALVGVGLIAALTALYLVRRKRRQRNPFAGASRGGWGHPQGGSMDSGDPKAQAMAEAGGMDGMDDMSIGSPINRPAKQQKAPSTTSGSSGTASGSGSSGTATRSAGDSVQEVALLSDVWNIKPEELQICKRPDGSEWLLGTGSFGQVFKGLKNGVADVAIKRLIQPDVLHLRLFQREISILKALNYDKSIVQFYGACLQGNNLTLVQEYMEGGDLRDALGADSDNYLGWYQNGAYLLMDVARGLHFLHLNRCVHRDLKTKNILLTKGGQEAKIADIGLAKLMGSQIMSSYTDTAGTFAYAAPELLLGNSCDTSADIYSFGVVLWEVVTHEVPIRGNLRTVKVPEECPKEVADLIDECLVSTPKRRPTAKQLFEALKGIKLQGTASSPSDAAAARIDAELPSKNVVGDGPPE